MPAEIHNSDRNNIHRVLHVVYVQAELVRSYPVGTRCLKQDNIDHGSNAKKIMTSPMDLDDMLLGYFARRTQINWVLHRCTSNSCKANGVCRFFLPIHGSTMSTILK